MITVLIRTELDQPDLELLDIVAADAGITRDQFVSNFISELLMIERDVRKEGYRGVVA